jgi:hypothetical protein
MNPGAVLARDCRLHYPSAIRLRIRVRVIAPARDDMRSFAHELVRTFFERKLLWALPVGLMLLALMVLIFATDVVPLAPFQLHHTL